MTDGFMTSDVDLNAEATLHIGFSWYALQNETLMLMSSQVS